MHRLHDAAAVVVRCALFERLFSQWQRHLTHCWAVFIYETEQSRAVAFRHSPTFTIAARSRARLRTKTHVSKNRHGRKSWRRCCCNMHFCSCKSEQKERAPRPNWNVVTTILYYSQNKPNENNGLQHNNSQLFFSITCFSKIDLKIEHVLIGVENRSRLRMTKKSSPVFDPVRRRPWTRWREMRRSAFSVRWNFRFVTECTRFTTAFAGGFKDVLY